MVVYKVHIDLPSKRNISLEVAENFRDLESAIGFIKEMKLTPSEVEIECIFYKELQKFAEFLFLDENYNITSNEDGYESE